MEYNLYQDCGCIGEYGDFETTEKEFHKCVKENPDSVIDILSEDGETSYLTHIPESCLIPITE